jgi:translation initiation factor IF-2
MPTSPKRRRPASEVSNSPGFHLAPAAATCPAARVRSHGCSPAEVPPRVEGSSAPVTAPPHPPRTGPARPARPAAGRTPAAPAAAARRGTTSPGAPRGLTDRRSSTGCLGRPPSPLELLGPEAAPTGLSPDPSVAVRGPVDGEGCLPVVPDTLRPAGPRAPSASSPPPGARRAGERQGVGAPGSGANDGYRAARPRAVWPASPARTPTSHT